MGDTLNQPASALWDEMLDQFRTVGGIAENICLRQGQFGRGLFAADPSKAIKLHVPESLLVDLKHVEFEANAFRVGPGAQIGFSEKTFLENYEREFSWGVSHSETEELLNIMNAAPAELRQFLAQASILTRWLVPCSPKAVQERYLYSRSINYRGRDVVMPIVELANHGYLTRYIVDEGVGLMGTFPEEILVKYDSCDPLEFFNRWGFVTDQEPFALSLGIVLTNQGLTIERQQLKILADRKPFFPEVSHDGGKIVFSHMLLGHRNFPRLARGNFYRAMRDAGRANVEEAFDAVQHINRMQLYQLLRLSEGADDPLGSWLRQLALSQLEAMSHSIGTREV